MTADGRLAEIRARAEAAGEVVFGALDGLPPDWPVRLERSAEDVPALLDEVERLRSMVSESIMDLGDYQEWKEAVTERDRLTAVVERVEALVADWQAYGDNAMKSAIARQGMGDEQELRRYAGLMWQRSRDLTAAIEGTDS